LRIRRYIERQPAPVPGPLGLQNAAGVDVSPAQGEALDGECPTCGSSALDWQLVAVNRGNAVDGRLSLSEIEPMLIHSCEECSETVKTLRDNEVRHALASRQRMPDEIRRLPEKFLENAQRSADNGSFDEAAGWSKAASILKQAIAESGDDHE